MNQKIRVYRINKLPVLLVYLLFFAVQIFFNLDVNRSVSSGNPAEYQLNAQRHSSVVIKKANANSHYQTNLRLNKRYHPSNIPVPEVMVKELATVLIEPVSLGSHLISFYPEVFLSTPSLRGPPALV